ncbi:MAG: type II secretion system F family protein [Oligoflexia bacterium]|nr:type II secretion system F family protein [Oligoflexia bacterium]
MGYLSLILAFILIAVSCYIVVRVFIGQGLSLEDQERLGIGTQKKVFPSAVLKLVYPVARRLVPSVAEWKIDKKRAILKKKIASAGLREVMAPDEFYAFQVALAFVIPFVVYVLNLLGGFGLSLVFLPVFIIFGWFYPGLWINGVIKTRKEQIKREMPFVVDLLTLCVEAGLDFQGAMGKVVEKGQKGPLRYEFETVMQEIKIGATRSEALKSMAQRIDLKEISSFVSILVTAERMGSPIGDVLRSQSDSIRHERFMTAEKKGGEASTKILIPMAVFILPAVFIVIFGPIILQKIYGG